MSTLNHRDIAHAAEIIRNTKLSNHTIYTIGNGGSASTAAHICNDLTKKDINAICLSSNISTITAIGNDMSFDNIFSFQVESFMKKGDVLIAFSTSGESKNILKALESARKKHLQTISITGFDGGNAKLISDYNINVKSDNIQIIEDIHLCISHILACKAKTLLTGGKN